MSKEIVAVGCPFCGEAPTVEVWHGGGHDKHMVFCSNDACHVAPAVSGATRAAAIRRWNTRAPNAALTGAESVPSNDVEIVKEDNQ